MGAIRRAEDTTFGDLLRRYRQAVGLTQEELAERARLSTRAVSDLERGLARRPRRETMQLLAVALQLSAQDASELAAARGPWHGSASDVAAGTPGGTPHNLPTAPTPFLGREQERAAARAYVLRADVRLVSLLGPGGSGKTRLAVQVATEVLAAFPGGVYFVGLAALRDPALVPSSIAQALDVQEGAGRPVLETVTAYLRDKQVLLLLDNVEHLLAAAPVVSALLAAAPMVKVLVTSREVLRISGEHEVWVPPLTLPEAGQPLSLERAQACDAVCLFLARAQAVVADFVLGQENAAQVVAVCRQLDGLPLALELAAARLRLLPLSALRERLARRLPLLIGGARDAPERQQTLRNTIAWSYDLLAPAEQGLFRQLGVFEGGCTLEAVAAVCTKLDGCEEQETAIEALVAKSLLRREIQPDGTPRLVMLETIREFAREQLEGHGELAALQERHLRHFLAWAEAACQHLYRAEQLVWYGLLDREQGNLRASLAWCVRQGESGDGPATEAGLRLAGALASWYWPLHGVHAESLSWLEQLFSLPQAQRRTAGRARALLGAGLLTVPSGWFPRAGETPTWMLCDEARVIGLELGDERTCAMACLLLGYTLPDAAARQASREEALQRYRATGDAWGMAMSVWAVGEGRAAAGDLRGARLCFEESLATNVAVGDGWVADAAKTGLARVAWADGDVTTARTLLEESTALMRDFGDARSIGLNLARLGELAQDVGDSAAARSLYRQALPIFLDTGDHGKIGDVLLGLASLAAAEGAVTSAVRLAGAAAGITHAAAWIDDERWSTRQNWLSPPQLCEVAGRRLDRHEVAGAWAQGQAMTVEQAVAMAVAEPAST